MPILNELKNNSNKKIMILGSGALTIGQAGEFDYSGSQAVAALEEEGYEVIVVNPNIATVQTNCSSKRKVYLYPVNKENVEKVIEKEKPAAIMGGFGGQTALNCLIDLEKNGILKKHNVLSLGTSVETLVETEDRQRFARKLESLKINALPFRTFTDLNSVSEFADESEYPLIVRSAFALGGLGSGFANNKQELLSLVSEALRINPQVIVERSIAGWKELEYEVLRDSFDNTICICNMENIDPLGIHTGDSVVVAPSQTINNEEFQLLRDVSIKIVRSLNIIGECNVQFALDPDTLDYYVIEINARLSRSSALASKATGYPIAYIAAKVVLGYSLLELKNPITGNTTAFFEPALDYITVKFPKWDLDKFIGINRELGSKMKSVGEVMAIGRSFTEAFQKAGRMILENDEGFLYSPFEGIENSTLEKELRKPTDKRIFAIFEALRRGYTVSEIFALTKISHWFLFQIKKITDIHFGIALYGTNFRPPDGASNFINSIPLNELKSWKLHGFSDSQIAKIFVSNKNFELSKNDLTRLIYQRREKLNLKPFIKKIDTTASEFPTSSNYLYMTYHGNRHDVEPSKVNSYLLLGSGPYRVGSSVEFDWCGVSASVYLKKLGLASIVLNCNPETVSTDYNTSSRLYFEEISIEVIQEIHSFEIPIGVIANFGGQTSNNLIPKLPRGINLLGHKKESIQNAENRTLFSSYLDRLGIKQPKWVSAANTEEINRFVKKAGLPVLIRPSFVLSGTAMKIAYDNESLKTYLNNAAKISSEYPVILTEYLTGAKEFETDGVADNGNVIIDVISEHIENAGVHSGDATIVIPAMEPNPEILKTIKRYTKEIVRALSLNGPFNIQYIVKDSNVMVIECNARASRSFPFISKAIKENLAEIATAVIIGKNDRSIAADIDLKNKVAVKASMFSFNRLEGVDPVQGVEMTSTGEVGCIGECFEEVYVRALESTGIKTPKKGILLSTGPKENKELFLEALPYFKECSLPLFATEGTADFFLKHGLKVQKLNWMEGGNEEILRLITMKEIDLVVNIPKDHKEKQNFNNGLIRQAASTSNCSLFTNPQKAVTFFKALQKIKNKSFEPQFL